MMRRVADSSLWLGHAGHVRDLRGLLDGGIRAVVDLAMEEPPAATLTHELVYCRFPLVDGPDNPRWILQIAIDTVVALARSATPTLVACGVGMSRSPCIAGAALAKLRGCPAGEGLALAVGVGAADVSPGLWAVVEMIVG